MKRNERKETKAEKEWYKEKIVEMIGQIENEKYLKMIYGFVKRFHRE